MAGCQSRPSDLRRRPGTTAEPRRSRSSDRPSQHGSARVLVNSAARRPTISAPATSTMRRAHWPAKSRRGRLKTFAVTESSSPGPTYGVFNPVSSWSQQKVSNLPSQVSTKAPDVATPEHVTAPVDTGRHALRAFGTKSAVVGGGAHQRTRWSRTEILRPSGPMHSDHAVVVVRPGRPSPQPILFTGDHHRSRPLRVPAGSRCA